jgi:mono/diheme cytochrome c family protein
VIRCAEHSLSTVFRPQTFAARDGMTIAKKDKGVGPPMTRIPTKFASSTISSALTIAVAGLLVVFQPVTALAAPPDQATQNLFNQSCASCHGKNGAGTPVGKSLNAPDLGSAAVQSKPDAQLRQLISDGKNNMPPFKSSLSEAQIDSLVAYIRIFSKQQK